MSQIKPKHVLLTGLPGVGKTTLIMKVCKTLKEHNIPLNGFVTQEIRNESNTRIGFDVIALDGKKGKLARQLSILSSSEVTKFRVGQYSVFPEDFERLVLPLFKNLSRIFIIDEIGRMELFSQKFQQEVQSIFNNQEVTILATIPVKVTSPLVENLRTNPTCTVINVTRANRDNMENEILSLLNVDKK